MITLTPEASTHITEYLTNRGKGLGIRVAVKTTGCSGFAYVIEAVDTPEEDDIRFPNGSIDIYVDPKSLLYVSGSELHYTRQGVNEGLEFRNPNSKGECGCGESFNV